MDKVIELLSKKNNQNKLFFIVKKTEKLCSVINFLLKNAQTNQYLVLKIKKVSLDSLLTAIEMGLGDTRDSLILNFAKTTSLLNLARDSGLISENNHQVLISEYERLSFILTDMNLEEQYKTNIKDNLYIEEPIIKDNNLSPKNQSIKEINKEKIYLKDTSIKFLKENNLATSTKNTDLRTERILNIIKDKGEVSIKDVSLIIKDIGEKTIQRELLRMSSSGIIKKVGERRWSKYIISDKN